MEKPQAIEESKTLDPSEPENKLTIGMLFRYKAKELDMIEKPYQTKVKIYNSL